MRLVAGPPVERPQPVTDRSHASPIGLMPGNLPPRSAYFPCRALAPFRARRHHRPRLYLQSRLAPGLTNHMAPTVAPSPYRGLLRGRAAALALSAMVTGAFALWNPPLRDLAAQHLERVNRATATAPLSVLQPCCHPGLLPGHAVTGTTGSLPLRQFAVVSSAAISTTITDTGADLLVAAAVHAELQARHCPLFLGNAAQSRRALRPRASRGMPCAATVTRRSRFRWLTSSTSSESARAPASRDPATRVGFSAWLRGRRSTRIASRPP